MLTAEQNDELTQVGAGTPMGEVLRHYWYPVAFARELDEFPVKKARAARRGLRRLQTARRHATASPMSAARTAGVARLRRSSRTVALRCGYHGWKFDADGKCIDILAEPDSSPAFRDRVCVQAGEGAGARRAGVGVRRHDPGGPLELPRYEAYVMDGCPRHRHSLLPCNWLQIMENAVDPYHVEALHGNYFAFIAE